MGSGVPDQCASSFLKKIDTLSEKPFAPGVCSFVSASGSCLGSSQTILVGLAHPVILRASTIKALAKTSGLIHCRHKLCIILSPLIRAGFRNLLFLVVIHHLPSGYEPEEEDTEYGGKADKRFFHSNLVAKMAPKDTEENKTTAIK